MEIYVRLREAFLCVHHPGILDVTAEGQVLVEFGFQGLRVLRGVGFRGFVGLGFKV